MKASCLCGQVVINIEGDFDYAGYCHCSECQKFSGSGCSAFGGVKKAKVTIIGKQHITHYTKCPGSHIGFCSQCGSCLYNEKIAWDTTNIRLGLLDDATEVEPSFHVYVGSKAPWHHWTDELVKYDELPV